MPRMSRLLRERGANPSVLSWLLFFVGALACFVGTQWVFGVFGEFVNHRTRSWPTALRIITGLGTLVVAAPLAMLALMAGMGTVLGPLFMIQSVVQSTAPADTTTLSRSGHFKRWLAIAGASALAIGLYAVAGQFVT